MGIKRIHVGFMWMLGLVSLITFFPVNSFACGGQGPCPGTIDGKHGHAHLVIIDLTTGEKIPTPEKIGLKPMKDAKGNESFCYEAVHTHHQDGTLHFQIDKRNDYTLGAFLTKWGRAGLLTNTTRVTADGETVKDPMKLVLKSEMNIEILFHGPPKAE